MRDPLPGPSTVPTIAQSPAASPTKQDPEIREPGAEVNPRRALRDRCCACPSDRFPSYSPTHPPACGHPPSAASWARSFRSRSRSATICSKSSSGIQVIPKRMWAISLTLLLP